jgi:hypothetical protein
VGQHAVSGPTAPGRRRGSLWHGRYPLAPALSTTRWEADRLQATLGVPGITVIPIVAVWGTPVPWGQVMANGVTVVTVASLPGLLRSLPPVLIPQRAVWAAAQLNRRLRTNSRPVALRSPGPAPALPRSDPVSNQRPGHRTVATVYGL